MKKQKARSAPLYLTIVVLIMVLISVVLFGSLQFSTTDRDIHAEHKEYVIPSKYENIHTKTVEDQSDEKRYLLHASWPTTENETINTSLDAFASDFISEFEEVSADIKQSREEYIRETGNDGVTFHASYNLHFDVSFANDDYVAFTFTKHRNTGNTGTDEISTVIYDRNTGEEIPLSSLFADPNYLERLSELTRRDLYERVESSADESEFDSEDQRKEWIKSFKTVMVDPGTEPTEDNFSSIVINSEGFLEINFDKYQVAPGTWGVVTVQIPLSEVRDLFSEEVRSLFDLNIEPEKGASAQPPINTETPSGKVDCSVEKCVALTFDDGPSAYTAELISILSEKRIKATFFVLGINARIQQQTILDLTHAGMEIGNHTWDHKDLTKLSIDEINDQVNRTADLIETITGSRPELVRPPYGAINEATAIAINAPVVLWNVDPEDWRYQNSEYITSHVVENAKPGAIILAHDIYETTVKAMPGIIDELQAAGYRFVTVSELVGEGRLVDGKILSYISKDF